MRRDELLDTLSALAHEAKASDETMPAAGVLFCLCAAMAEGTERALLDVTVPFSQEQIERLTGEPDWSDDTLKV